MSAMQQLRDSGLFEERPPQPSNESVCFQVLEGANPRYGASVYVVRNESEFHIRVGALENNRFPNNQRLHDFVVEHQHGTGHGEENSAYAYRLASEHIGAAIEIIHAG